MRLGAEQTVKLGRPVETPQPRSADGKRIAVRTIGAWTSRQKTAEPDRAGPRRMDLGIEVGARHAPGRCEMPARRLQFLLDARFGSSKLVVALGGRQRLEAAMTACVRANRHAGVV